MIAATDVMALVRRRAESEITGEARDWLTRDERGIWEAMAARLLASPGLAERAAAIGLDDAGLADATATEVILACLETIRRSMIKAGA